MAYGTVKASEIVALLDTHLGTDWKLGTAAEVVIDVNAAAAIAMSGTLSVAGIITALLGFVELPEITTPAAVADSGKVYTKADNKVYFQDGAGAEHEVAIDTSGVTTLAGDLTAANVSVLGDLTVPTKTPSAANDTGTLGTVAWDASYIYVCSATDTWLRAAIATWP